MQGVAGRSLEAVGFEVIKQYDGQEQVDLKVGCDGAENAPTPTPVMLPSHRS